MKRPLLPLVITPSPCSLAEAYEMLVEELVPGPRGASRLPPATDAAVHAPESIANHPMMSVPYHHNPIDGPDCFR